MEAKVIASYAVESPKRVILIKELEDYNNLNKAIGTEVSKYVVENGQIVECNPMLSVPRYASPNIVPPYAVLILDRDANTVLSRYKSEVYINVDKGTVKLRLPMYITSYPEVFNDISVLRLLALLGDLRKQIFSMNTGKGSDYIWELMAYSDTKEITRLLNSVPKELRRTFDKALRRNICYPSSSTFHKDKDTVLVNVFFIYDIIEDYSDPPIILLQDWVLDRVYEFSHKSRIKRYFEVIKGGIINTLRDTYFATDSLRRHIKTARFYVGHAEDTYHELEFLVNQLQQSVDPLILDGIKRTVIKDLTLAYSRLSKYEKSVTFSEGSLISMESVVNNTFQLVESDFITLIQVVMTIAALYPLLLKYIFRIP